MRPELEIVEDKAALIVRAADWIEALLRSEVNAEHEFSIALAGGSTPGPVYAELAARHRAKPLPWNRVALYFGDERAVGPDDPDSNYREARQTLIDPVGIGNFAAVHRMHGEAPDLEAEAERYAALLPARFDLIILGVGEDGHTASLFPGQASISEEDRSVLAVIGPKPPPKRITLAPAVLRAAHRILVLGSGAGKAEALARAMDDLGDSMSTPVRLARPVEDGQTRHWILDEPAAERLPQS